MPEKSVFREFISSLRKRWKREHPFIQPLAVPWGVFPKASTFYAGVSRASGRHVFLNFQHSPKSWEVGSFAINVVLAIDRNSQTIARGEPKDERTGDDYKRIGHLLGRRDKWWHLKDNGDAILSDAWRPASYENPEAVIDEAIDDVTRDVMAAMKLLEVPAGE